MIIISKNLNKNYLINALELYNFYIINSFSNFEEKKVTIRTFNFLYKNIKLNKLPFLIAVENKEVVGMAYVNKFREKSGYRFTFEHSIYVNPKFTNKGYGSKILKELLNQCKNNKKIKNLIAVIGGSDNTASIKLHKKYGFRYIGTITKAGYKKKKWVDSVYMQKRL